MKKVGIVIVVYNLDSRIFILQIEAIRKFCKDDNYWILIYDNSDDPDKAEAIRYHAQLLKVNAYRRTHAESGDYSRSHAFSASMAFRDIHKEHDYLFFLDHDCLPVKPFSVVDILGQDIVMAGLGQGLKDHTYFWPGCVMWNNNIVDKELINFYPEPPLDTGAGLREVIKEYGEDKCIFFDESYWGNPYYTEGKYNYYSMLHNCTFMHFVNSSNWNTIPDNDRRINSLITIAKQKIDDSK